jgi:hypothetical protein
MMSLRVNFTISLFLAVACFAITNCAAQTSMNNVPREKLPKASIPQDELAKWRAAEERDTSEMYRGYLVEFPNGWFASLARQRLEPGLPSPLPPEIYIAPNEQPNQDQLNAIRAREDSIWASAQAIGTQKAMQDYLIAFPFGTYTEIAVQQFKSKSVMMPSTMAPDCSVSELFPQKIRGFNFGRAYPQAAIDRGIEGMAIGKILVDHRGYPLAFTAPFYVRSDSFAISTQRSVLGMLYNPIKAGCAELPTLASFIAEYRFADTEFFVPDLRSTPETPNQSISLDTPTNLQIPAGSAYVVELPPANNSAVYKITTKSRFTASVHFSRIDTPFEWTSLTDKNHFIAFAGDKVAIRLSVAVPPPNRWRRPATVAPTGGPIEVTITRIHSF